MNEAIFAYLDDFRIEYEVENQEPELLISFPVAPFLKIRKLDKQSPTYLLEEHYDDEDFVDTISKSPYPQTIVNQLVKKLEQLSN